MGRAVREIKPFIEEVEQNISTAKERGRRQVIDFSIMFRSFTHIEKFKSHFEKQGYDVWTQTCRSGRLTDYKISWKENLDT